VGMPAHAGSGNGIARFLRWSAGLRARCSVAVGACPGPAGSGVPGDGISIHTILRRRSVDEFTILGEEPVQTGLDGVQRGRIILGAVLRGTQLHCVVRQLEGDGKGGSQEDDRQE
jgi:hypothetical protein